MMDHMEPNLYFNILCAMVHGDYVPNPAHYRKVLWQLHSTQFVPIMKMDENRVKDALNFRFRCFYDDKTEPVSVLELMVSLSDRLETETMQGTADRDRTADWFWAMMDSLGLVTMTDELYDEEETSRILRRFMRRRYSRNGRGGLFTIKHHPDDMRKHELWYQAALYLDEVLRTEGFIEL